MGFLDKLFGGSASDGHDSRRKLSFSQLDGWIGQESFEYSRRAEQETKPLIADVLEAASRLKHKVLELQKLPDENVPPRLERIVATSKPEYVSSMLDVLDAITAKKSEGEKGYARVKDFQTRLSESLERIAKLTVSQGRYLPLVHGDALAGIQREFKNLIDAGKKLDSQLASYDRIPLLESAQAAKGALDALERDQQTAEAQLSALRDELATLEKKLAFAQSERARLSEDKQLMKLKRESEDAIDKRKSIESSIGESLSSVNRPLRKYQKLAVSEKILSKEALDSIQGFIERPVETFLSSRHLNAILKDMEKALAEGKIEVKNPEKEAKKTSELVQTLTPSLAEEYRRAVEKEELLRDEISNSPLTAKDRELASAIQQTVHAVTALHGELATLDKKKREMEAKKSEAKKELEECLEDAGVALTDGP